MSTAPRLVILAIGLGTSGLMACTGELWVEDGRREFAQDSGPSDAPWPSSEDAAAPATGDAFVARPDAAVPPPPDAWSPPIVGCDDPIEQEVIALVNASRTSMGLGAVRCDPAMTAVARGHSSDMCSRGYFDHTGLDGRDPFDRLRDGGVRFSSAGENIAWGQSDADEVHTAWMNSAGHRRNILDGDYARIGVGLDRCGGDMYWTEVFAD
jgi:uncharacterized protein YkwD